MKHFNCFVKFAGAKEEYSMFIQIPEDIMNNIDPQAIKRYIDKWIAKRFYGDSKFARITNVTILGCYESKV